MYQTWRTLKKNEQKMLLGQGKILRTVFGFSESRNENGELMIKNNRELYDLFKPHIINVIKS